MRIELLDVAAGLPERYEAIATFDVVHDAADPLGLLRAIHDGLEPGGSYLLVDIRTADDPHENVGPLATLLYGASVFYCMTEAGFASVRRLPVDSPFNALYEATV